MALVLYGSSGDVRAEMGNPDEAEYSASDLNRARTRATNVVNAYVEPKYPDKAPFASNNDVPELLKTITDDLAVYFAKRSKHPGPSPLSEDIKTEYYDKSIDMLKMILEGDLTLPELTSSDGEPILAAQSSYTPIFNLDGELEQKIDDDLLDDIADSRA